MLANQIIILRKQAGMSQSQLAKELNVGPSAVGMYEQGRRTPGIDMLIQMAQLFEVSLDYLITGNEALNSTTGEEDVVSQFSCPCMTCRFGCNKLKLRHIDNHSNNEST